MSLMLFSGLVLGMLSPFLFELLLSHPSESIRSRPVLMVPLSTIRHVLLHVAFSRNMVDYDETFASIAHRSTVQTLVVVASIRQ